ncbi:hypothetical protein BJ508DRAFT_362200 [Ascobolus immersus RN42]|uniref:Protein-lysine N-methyltransferase EFM6 n=1 Tax=Ascobolus immersus RN42 TaxID=1160509 RepID=A0A3N4I4G0_ASCIM|nr:hypothetical protein BJ508DRAFT_362200 [Ascobolus immersus RN42]
MSAAPLFWQQPLRYMRFASHEYPAIFYSCVIGAVSPAILLVVPPVRRRLGYDDTPEIPHSYPATSTTTLNSLLTTPLSLHQDLANGCGGIIWPAGECLGRYVVRRYVDSATKPKEESLSGKRILEIGAGGGVTGLALISALRDAQDPAVLSPDASQRCELWLTDQSNMLDLMHKNVALNAMAEIVKVGVYDWGEPIPPYLVRGDTEKGHKVDVVLAADCVYFEPAFPLLEKTLVELVRGGTVCLFCFKKRRRADLKFMKRIVKVLECREVKDYPEYEMCSRDSIFLYEMTEKKGKGKQ